MANNLTRRDLIRHTGMAAGLTALGGVFTDREARASRSAAEKLNIGIIGAGGQGSGDAVNVSTENIVALCDVDDARAAESYKRFPGARRYADFRKLLDQRDIDAVTISTPDHCHAPAAVMAMRMGKHVYCQKPLAHTVYEARVMTEVAAECKVATQMGTQNHSHESYIRLVEIVKSGAIGGVTQVHVITDRPAGWWPQGMKKPAESETPPSTLNWDLWLGPAAMRPFHNSYLPFVWRGWWDFGTGALGDMACHLMDPVFWALNLKYPTRVIAASQGATDVAAPNWSIINYEFGPRKGMSAVTVIWYDGGRAPAPEVSDGVPIPKGFNGSVWIGTKGKLVVEHGELPKFMPEAKFADYKGPEKHLPRPTGHHADWIQAAKNGTQPGSNFSFAGPMTETLLIGNVAVRTRKTIEVDPRYGHVKGLSANDPLLRMPYREGYSL